GHEKGAFTGAVERRAGSFEQANEGTVFLDEIGTIDERVQVSLLRLIEQKKFHRLGGRQLVSCDIRLIAATNADLMELVRDGVFREDLFYRLDVFRITLPPLGDRQGDFPLLIDEFVRRYNEMFEKRVRGIAPECISLLEAHTWPGHVRELKNVIQRAVLVCEGDVIMVNDLPPRFGSGQGRSHPTVAFRVGTTLDEVEREMIVRTLADTDNNRKRAAELLGISRRALYNRLRKHRID
ncbi:MAG: sigma 54-interacting transcriptional regulator, partial [bacterium]